MVLTIKDASIRQLEKLYEIETGCFLNESFTKQQISHLLTDYNSVSLAAKINSEIVGFIIGVIHIERNAPVGHIVTIDVSPRHRLKGIAQRLLQEIEEIFKEKGVKSCCLEVREDNIPALRLYQKFGYHKVAKLKGYYGNVHGLYLRKDLV